MNVRPFDQPWETNYARQADEAFARATVPDAVLRGLKPPLPQIEYLPPRFGYPSYDERQWGIMEVFGITRSPNGGTSGFPRTRGEDRVDYTRDQASMQGSARGANDPLGMGAGGM